MQIGVNFSLPPLILLCKKVSVSSKLKIRRPKGRPAVIQNPKRFDLMLPQKDYDRASKLVKRAKKLGVPGMSLAFIYRQGGRELMKQLEGKFTKAENGELHAKKRKT